MTQAKYVQKRWGTCDPPDILFVLHYFNTVFALFLIIILIENDTNVNIDNRLTAACSFQKNGGSDFQLC